MVAAENLDVPSTRVVGSKVVAQEKVAVPTSSQGASSSGTRDNITAIPGIPPLHVIKLGQGTRVIVKKSWNPNWDIVTYEHDTDPKVNVNESSSSEQPPAANAHVKPVTGQSDTSTASNAAAEEGTDGDINPDMPFERNEIRLAQVSDDSIGMVCLLYTSPSPRD